MLDSSHNHNPANEAALKLLNKKTLTTGELRAALEKKDLSSHQIEDALQSMHHLGYLNDEAIATRLLEDTVRKKRGWLWLRKQLVEKEIPNEINEKIQRQSQQTAYERANSSLQNKLRYKSLSRNQAFRFLLNRGFEIELVDDIIRAHFGEEFCLE